MNGIPYNGKTYCFSPCAKDKFQTYIIKPISTLTSLTLLFAVIYVAVFLLGLIVTLIFPPTNIQGLSDPLFFLFIDMPIVYGLAFPLLAVVTLVITYGILGRVYRMFKWTNRKLDNWCNTKYENKYKPECKLFVECEA